MFSSDTLRNLTKRFIIKAFKKLNCLYMFVKANERQCVNQLFNFLVACEVQAQNKKRIERKRRRTLNPIIDSSTEIGSSFQF